MIADAPADPATSPAASADEPPRPISSRWSSRWIYPDSGPVIARTFHGLLGLIFVIAFASLAAQIDLLFAADGLAPIGEFVALLREQGIRSWLAPSPFWWSASDIVLHTAAIAGIVCGLLALLGRAVRPCLALATGIYLGFVGLGAPFLGFQWDSLLLECGLLAVLLPRGRAAPVIHLLFTFLLFKIYFESGIAKWYSPLGDWHDGSAMSFYYETAPIPTRLGWYAHHLPASWHLLEAWAVLALELLAPLLFFAGRRGRLLAFVGLTGFQLINLATANYGFFVHLALILHLFLLRDEDLARPRRWLARLPAFFLKGPVPEDRQPGRLVTALTTGFAAIYLMVSVLDARANFSDDPTWQRWQAALAPIYAPLRMINTYHLFAQITRTRFEPEFATRTGDVWVAHALHYKPGPLDRSPPFVAPHQPRLDFQLWFYGLDMEGRPPDYVLRLLLMLCRDPARAQAAFADPLPSAPDAVRLRFWDYHFSAPGSDAWWTRTEIGDVGVLRCADLPP